MSKIFIAFVFATLIWAMPDKAMAQSECGLLGRVTGTCNIAESNEGDLAVQNAQAASEQEVARIESRASIDVANIEAQAQQAIANANASLARDEQALRERIAEINRLRDEAIARTKAEASIAASEAQATTAMHVSDNDVTIANIGADTSRGWTILVGIFLGIVAFLSLLAVLLRFVDKGYQRRHELDIKLIEQQYSMLDDKTRMMIEHRAYQLIEEREQQ